MIANHAGLPLFLISNTLMRGVKKTSVDSRALSSELHRYFNAMFLKKKYVFYSSAIENVAERCEMRDIDLQRGRITPG